MSQRPRTEFTNIRVTASWSDRSIEPDVGSAGLFALMDKCLSLKCNPQELPVRWPDVKLPR